jgi:tetratricopeptide (TPR) repeat protein
VSPQQSLSRGIELTKHAISLDNTYSFAHAVLGASYAFARQYDQGVAEAERAVALDPNSPENLFFLAHVLCFAGKPEEAIPLIEIAQRLNPIPPPFQLLTMSSAYRLTGEYEKAAETAKRAIRMAPNNPIAHVHLIAPYIALGRRLCLQGLDRRVVWRGDCRRPRVGLGTCAGWLGSAENQRTTSSARLPLSACRRRLHSRLCSEAAHAHKPVSLHHMECLAGGSAFAYQKFRGCGTKKRVSPLASQNALLFVLANF